MNVNELASGLYSTGITGLSSYKAGNLTQNNKISDELTTTFDQILSGLTENDTINGEEKNELVNTLTQAVSNLSFDTSDDQDFTITEMLTDAQIAKEYLESTTGRQVLTSMAENSIASIITGNN